MKLFTKQSLLLLGIILFALVLRWYHFDTIPEGFHSDEAAYGYNAYSLLLTGKDEYGVVPLISFQSFDDYKGAFYIYLTIPFVWLLGLTEAAVRLPSVLFGVAFVPLVYLTMRRLTADNTVSVIAALLAAISPVGILLSRVQSDPFISVFFIVAGVYSFLLWVDKKKNLFLFGTGLLWFLSFVTYFSPRVFVPLLMVFLGVFYGKKLWKEKRKLFLPVFILILVIDGLLFVGTAKERFAQLSIFNTPVVMLPLEEQIREDGHDSALIARAYHNKLVGYGTYALQTYFSYFSYDFLFLDGGKPVREFIPGVGFLHVAELPFLLLGIYAIVVGRKRWGYFLLLWLFGSALPLSLAVDETPNIHRFATSTFAFYGIIAYGIVWFFQLLKPYKQIYRSAFVIVLAVFLYSLSYFLHQLFVHQPIHYPYNRGHAYKALVGALQNYAPNYREVMITKGHASPYIYILFYTRYDPTTYQQEGSPRDLGDKGFAHYRFTEHDCPVRVLEDGSVSGQPGILYVNKGTCKVPVDNTKLIQTIPWRDGSPAFQLVEYVATGSSR